MIYRLTCLALMLSFIVLAVYANGEREHGYSYQEREALRQLIERTEERKVALIHELYEGAYE